MQLHLLHSLPWLSALMHTKKRHPHKLAVEGLQMIYAAWKTWDPDHAWEEGLPSPMGICPGQRKHPTTLWIGACRAHYQFAMDQVRMLILRRDKVVHDWEAKGPAVHTLLGHVKRLKKAGVPPGMPERISYSDFVSLVESNRAASKPRKRKSPDSDPPPPPRMRCLVSGTNTPVGTSCFPLCFGYLQPDDYGSLLLDRVYESEDPMSVAFSLDAVQEYRSYYASKTQLEDL